MFPVAFISWLFVSNAAVNMGTQTSLQVVISFSVDIPYK